MHRSQRSHRGTSNGPDGPQFLGRGGFAGPAVPPGSYLVKVTIGDKVIAQKTLVVEADTTFMVQ